MEWQEAFGRTVAWGRRCPLLRLWPCSLEGAPLFIIPQDLNVFWKVLLCPSSAKVTLIRTLGEYSRLGGCVTFVSYFMIMQFWWLEHCFRSQLEAQRQGLGGGGLAMLFPQKLSWLLTSLLVVDSICQTEGLRVPSVRDSLSLYPSCRLSDNALFHSQNCPGLDSKLCMVSLAKKACQEAPRLIYSFASCLLFPPLSVYGGPWMAI